VENLAIYDDFVKDIKSLIYQRQYETMKVVNKALIQLYWEIGEEIYRRQQEQGWGKSVVEILSKELQKEFPRDRGYSARNLWLMRSFYVEYSQNTILHPMGAELEENSQHANLHPSGAEINRVSLPPLLAEIGWKKNTIIMEKCKDRLMREFYIKMTKRFGWTKDVLINNIENNAYEKFLVNQTNFDKTVAEKYKNQAKLAVKDDYNFGFLEMSAEHSEHELEVALMQKIRAFLIEMGGKYSYIGNQYHVDFADEDNYIDILLFHRQLRSLIAIDLKIGDFLPEYAGKMQYYLAILDEKVKLPEENPSIGIIVCKNKNRLKVEYALKTSNAPIGVATYTLHDKLPDDMRKFLPSPEEIAEIIKELD